MKKKTSSQSFSPDPVLSNNGSEVPLRNKTSFILVTGGTRSGKSRFAVDVANSLSRRIVYIATCQVGNDREMEQRVAHHRKNRPRHWKTIESPFDLVESLRRLKGKAGGIIVDCLTMYVSDLLMRGDSDVIIQQKIRSLCKAASNISCPVIVVTNEVGSGIVPDHELGRRFRDIAGLANQIAAGFADQVFFLVAGIPVQIKGSGSLLEERNDAVTPARHSNPRT